MKSKCAPKLENEEPELNTVGIQENIIQFELSKPNSEISLD